MATSRTFKDIVDLMDNLAGEMPEGNYVSLYNKLRDLKKICDSHESQEARLESFWEGYQEAESDMQWKVCNELEIYKEKCARLTIENSEYKKTLELEQQSYQEIYDLNRNTDEEVAELKNDNKRLELLLDQSNDEVEKQKTAADDLRVELKQLAAKQKTVEDDLRVELKQLEKFAGKQKAVADDLKVRLKHFERFAEKRFKEVSSRVTLEKRLARRKMTKKMMELQESVNIFKEEKRERVKAAADTSKPAIIIQKKCKSERTKTTKPAINIQKKCKCGSTTHFRTNHKECKLNKKITTAT